MEDTVSKSWNKDGEPFIKQLYNLNEGKSFPISVRPALWKLVWDWWSVLH